MKNELDQTMIPVKTEKVISSYWHMADDEFKERLFMITSNDQRRQIKIKQWLETDMTLLPFMKHHACLIADFYSLNMELDVYKTYINMIQSETLWLSQLSKSVIKWNKISQKLVKTQLYIKKQMKTFERQLKKMTQKLIDYLQQEQQHVSTLSIIDMNLLKAFIITFVRQDQQQLPVELDKKRHLLMLNVNDVRLVKEFFDLKPNAHQEDIAGCIWQATVHEQRAKKEIQYAEQCMLTDNEDLIIKEAKERFLTNQITEAKIQAQNDAQMIEDKKKLFLVINQQQQLNNDLLMNIIESRQRILIQRIQFNRDFNKIFFNDDCDDNSDDENDDDDKTSDINENIQSMNDDDDDEDNNSDNDSMNDYMYI